MKTEYSSTSLCLKKRDLILQFIGCFLKKISKITDNSDFKN